MSDPNRPLLRWHGGKWRLAPWIIDHFPPHRIYVEPFGGAASVLLRKPRAYAEIYNDLDDDLVNIFRMLRDEASAERLVRLLEQTPFARGEFERSYRPSRDPVERARRMIVRSFMGFGTDGTCGIYRTGFRSKSNRSHTTPAHDWASYPPALRRTIDRLAGVVIENRDATEVMLAHDGPHTLHYVDPPYMHETRSRRTNRRGIGVIVYNHELSDQDHSKLLDFLQGLRGMVVLSGYRSPTYDAALKGWRCVEKAARADGGRARTEVLWINPAAREAASSPTLWCASERATLVREPRHEGQAAQEDRQPDGLVPLHERQDFNA